jgi:hypothetical protein
MLDRKQSSKRIPEINSLYAYRTRHKAKFTHRHQAGSGYKYTNHNAILKSSDDGVHIYHMTATIKGVTNGLTLVTHDSSTRRVRKFFTDQIKAIKSSDTAFDRFSHATSTPVELGIFHHYE